MLEIGKTFKINNHTFCLLDILDLSSKRYALFSKENNDISFEFYEIFENGEQINFKLVEDKNLKYNLLEIFERRK